MLKNAFWHRNLHSGTGICKPRSSRMAYPRLGLGHPLTQNLTGPGFHSSFGAPRSSLEESSCWHRNSILKLLQHSTVQYSTIQYSTFFPYSFSMNPLRHCPMQVVQAFFNGRTLSGKAALHYAPPLCTCVRNQRGAALLFCGHQCFSARLRANTEVVAV